METILTMLLVPIIGVFVLALMIALDLLLAWPLMWTWNGCMPAVFHLTQLDYWQAFCLLVVSSMLIKSHSSSSAKS